MSRITGVILDVDGSLIRGDAALPGAPAALAALRRRGLRVAICTQESARTPAEVAARLSAMGLTVDAAEVVTAGAVTAAYLRRRWPGAPVYAIGAPGLLRFLRQQGIDVVGEDRGEAAAVVLVARDQDFHYGKLVVACRAIGRGARFLATNRDRVLPVAAGLLPGNGCIVQAIAYATRRRPLILGKPSRWMAAAALEAVGASPPTPAGQAVPAPCGIVVVGDQLDQDIRMGRNAGCTTVLLLSGGTAATDCERLPPGLRPHAVLPDITHLPRWLDQQQESS